MRLCSFCFGGNSKNVLVMFINVRINLVPNIMISEVLLTILVLKNVVKNCARYFDSGFSKLVLVFRVFIVVAP